MCQPPQPAAQRAASGGGPASSPDPELRAWLRESEAQLTAITAQLRGWHEARVAQLQTAAAAARATLWWPFTQHTSVSSFA
jgi:hypothetical protein